MKKIIVFFIVFDVLVFSYYYKNTNQEVVKKDFVVDNIKEEKNDYMIKINYNGKIEEIELEEYVVGVVSCEMPASFDYEALKSMAVAARTYALYKVNNKKGYVMKTTAVDQCYIDVDKMKTKWGSSFDKMYNKVKSAVNDTKYEFMTYKDDIIISFYFSISNGYTENCENVFSQKLDYLKSVSSEWDKDYNYKEKEVKYSIKDFLNKLSLTGNKIENISIDRTSTNSVTTININGKKFKGSKFKSLLSLRSTDIDIEYDEKNVYIKTKGYGHGVGMSQYGAHSMAKLGYKYDEILKYYYNGVEIVNNL